MKAVKDFDAELSNGNVFADLRLPGAENLQIKASLVVEIRKAIRRLSLKQEDAAVRMGITQPKVSAMMRGDFSGLSERKLMDCLSRLGYDIEIVVKKSKKPTGHIRYNCVAM